MIPVDIERVARDLASLPSRGRGASEEKLRAWAREHPTKPCAGCFGRGAFTDRAGARRSFDHRDFDVAKGDAFVSPCPDCRGLGRVFVSRKEARRLERSLLARQRHAYAELRAEIVDVAGVTPEHVDRVVRNRLRRDRSPEAWLGALVELARIVGVKP